MEHRSIRRLAAVTALLALLLALMGTVAPSTVSAESTSPPAEDDWLGWFNLYRAQAGLGPVSEDAAMSIAATVHSTWMLENQFVSHPECDVSLFRSDGTCTPIELSPGVLAAGSTVQGHTAGMQGNVLGWSTAISRSKMIELWMAGPFHTVGLIDPGLHTTGFGTARNDVLVGPGALVDTATLNILGGRSAPPANQRYPIVWPSDGSVSAITSLTTELPDPTTHCAGFAFPTGAPVIVQYETLTPIDPASTSLIEVLPDGTEIEREICAFDGTTTATGYTNPNSLHQQLGRETLEMRNAVVILPRHPLAIGASYDYVVATSGGAAPVTGTFAVSTVDDVFAPPLPDPLDPDPVDPVDPDPDPTFSDVGPTHPFFDEISWLVAEGITSGFADGTFRPTDAVSRQAMAAFLWRQAGEPSATCIGSFLDMPPGHPFEEPVCWMVAMGVANGFGDGTFRPENPVSRQATAAFLHRLGASPAPSGPVGADFSDVGPTHQFATPITWLVEEGIAGGFTNGTFRPTDSVSRQAMAAFLYRQADAG